VVEATYLDEISGAARNAAGEMAQDAGSRRTTRHLNCTTPDKVRRNGVSGTGAPR
jgi:hypothetical protein